LGLSDWALAFLDKASELHIKFVARMLRPYKNRYSFPEITKEGLKLEIAEIGGG
jgi:hypothetical protein